ncbi:MAG: hypothetical protein GOMPHAMPRED_008242 [Gomphillus americanus]|uniref:Uncharacterized protein n=1 Tax=Gomphillus americanus TaxID=1940652 RepID=A0A8H3EZG7_9LECA|nr:MAG: hypothetical protein GOMPHAMPRED_008242 [Gomphillus americanus]
MLSESRSKSIAETDACCPFLAMLSESRSDLTAVSMPAVSLIKVWSEPRSASKADTDACLSSRYGVNLEAPSRQIPMPASHQDVE